MSKPIYIFDLDGTLADITHRLFWIEQKNKQWDAFYQACNRDKPIPHTISLLKALRKSGAEIWIWTGRSDEVAGPTEEWLYNNGCLKTTMFLHWEPFSPPETLMMRRAGDHTPDHELKYGWLANLDPPERNRIAGVFEDRSSVVRMWCDAGVPCYQVAPGDF